MLQQRDCVCVYIIYVQRTVHTLSHYSKEVQDTMKQKQTNCFCYSLLAFIPPPFPPFFFFFGTRGFNGAATDVAGLRISQVAQGSYPLPGTLFQMLHDEQSFTLPPKHYVPSHCKEREGLRELKVADKHSLPCPREISGGGEGGKGKRFGLSLGQLQDQVLFLLRCHHCPLRVIVIVRRRPAAQRC